MESRGEMILAGENGKTGSNRPTYLNDILSTTNPTLNNPDLRREKPTTNRLSHGTA
jgi:hypothetical protein